MEKKWHTSCISVFPPLFPSFAFFLVVLITFDWIFTISPAPSAPPLGSLPCPWKHHHFFLPSAMDLWPFSLWTVAPTSRVNSCSLSTKRLQLIFLYLLLLECSFSLSFPTYLHLLVLATCPSLLYLFFFSPLSPHFPCQVPAQDFGNENTAAMPGKFMACLFLLSTPAPQWEEGQRCSGVVESAGCRAILF